MYFFLLRFDSEDYNLRKSVLGHARDLPGNMNGINGNRPADTVTENLESIEELKQAISAIYDPRSTNEVRKNATIYLDEAKTHPDAVPRGFTLASDLTQSPAIRHFGLSLLEYAIRYRWDDLNDASAESCRNMVIDLAQKIDNGERPFLRNKIAQLWVEIAKKVWPEQWHDLDSQLLQLWQSSFAHQMMALYMLEILSDDAFAKEEYGDGIKGGNIGKACTEIFMPSRVFLEYFPSRDQMPDIRSGEEGWFSRLVDRLSWCCSNILAGQEAKLCAVQVLNSMRSMASWIFLKAVSATGCMEALAKSLQSADVEIQTVRPNPAESCVLADPTGCSRRFADAFDPVTIFRGRCSRHSLSFDPPRWPATAPFAF